MKPPEKIDLVCPECGKPQEVLWFPWDCIKYTVTGSTGRPATKIDQRQEKIEGTCECGHKFKPEDLE